VVDDGYKELTEPADFEYVRVGIEQVPDAEAVVSDSDIEKYINENKVRYTNEEETRTVEYISFDVTPTLEDSMKLRDRISSLRDSFRNTTKDSIFAVTNNGVPPTQFQTKDQLSPAIKDSIFGAPVGTVMGPYVDAKAYWLAKVVDRKSAPDSVKARHILLKGAGMIKTADSLKALLVANPSLWDSLNTKYSGDEASKIKGGDLGYASQGMYVPQFNDLLFYKAAQGPFYTVETQFGAHIVQVTGIKIGKNESRVKVALIREPIVPSAKTDRAASALADEILLSSKNGAQLKENATKKNLALTPAPPVKANDLALGSFGQANGVRQLIRWAYEAKTGERANQSFAIQQQGEPFVSQYVVATLKAIAPKGLGTVAALKEQLTSAVRTKKKVEVLKAKMGNPSDLNAVASQYNSKIDTAFGVTFNATFLPKIGTEPRVLAAAFTNEIGKVSAPIAGESGVFVIKVNNRQTLTNSPVDKTALRQQLSGNIKNMVRGSLMRNLRKNASVTDNRSKFF
jgi:peptidyl-prolyl cis-trans isomerase D